MSGLNGRDAAKALPKAPSKDPAGGVGVGVNGRGSS